MAGSRPTIPPADDARKRSVPVGLGSRGGLDDHRSSPIDHARSVACGHERLRPEGRSEAGEGLSGRAPHHVVFVGMGDDDVTTSRRDGHGHDFLLEKAAVDGGFRAPVRQGRKGIHFLAGDALSLAQFIRGLRHEQAAGHVLQVGHHVILNRRRASEAPPVPCTAKHMRSLREVLHATRNHDLGLVEHDHLRAGNDGLHTGTANAGQGQHWNLLWNASLQARMAGAVNGLRTGLEGVAHHDVINRFRVRTRLFQRASNGGGPEVLRAHGLQTTAWRTVTTLSANPFAEGCACSANNHDVFDHDARGS